MKKRIYVIVWHTDDDSGSGVEGYWDRPLTDGEQHALMRYEYPLLYEKGRITWELVILKGKKPLPALPEWQRTECN